MTTKQISLNGTAFHPTSVDRPTEKIGKSLPAASGRRNWVQRSNKRQWDIAWDACSETVRAAVETIALLGTTFTFVDFSGTSYTAQCEGQCYSQSTKDEYYDYHNDTLKWDVKLHVFEQ